MAITTLKTTVAPNQPLKDKVNQFIVKLLRETHEGRIEWSRAEPPQAITRITEDVIDLYCVTRYGDERVGIWRRNYRADGPQGTGWGATYGLGLLGSGRSPEVLWDYEAYSPALKSLLTAARNQAARIEERLDQLLQTQPSGFDSSNLGTPAVTVDHR